ncbi:MAG: class E sortase [Solirubrobacterales bacterium]|nr:class E sortase [Solirubrobacterales bacterium]
MEQATAIAHTRQRSRSGALRRFIRDVSSVLIISGLLLMADAAVTLLWQEPLTALVGLIERGQIDKRYLSAQLTTADRNALGSLGSLDARIAFLARLEQRHVRTGAAIGRITISKIGANFDVVQGTDEASLEKGPGHYPATSFPGLGQTMAIAGHRTTYLAPFRHIDALSPGDQIVLKMPYARFTYVVQYHKIVQPTALWVTHNAGYDRLVLSACNPLYSAAQRIIVFARLRNVQASGASGSTAA